MRLLKVGSVALFCDNIDMNEQQSVGELRPIRTYERDVEEVLHGQNVSLSKIALAESVKRRAAPVLSEPMRIRIASVPKARIDFAGRLFGNRRFLFLISVLAAAAITLIAFAWYLGENESGTSASKSIKPSLTKIDGANITFTGELRTALIKRIRDETLKVQIPLGEFRTLVIQRREGKNTINLSLAELLDSLEASAPTALIRALESLPTIGVHGIRGNQLFLLSTVTSYDHAFEGMLSWEKQMIEDIGPLFGVNTRAASETHATTTKEVLSQRLVFRDVVVKNKDLRAVFDQTGKIIFLYSFPDKKSLIITTNDETFRALLPKIDAGRLR